MALDQFLAKHDRPLTGVVEMQVDEEELVRRMMARGRGDDKPEVIRERMAAYHAQTKPVSDYFRSRGLLECIDALGTMDEVFARLLGAVDRLAGKQKLRL